MDEEGKEYRPGQPGPAAPAAAPAPEENHAYHPGERVVHEEPPAPRRICGFWRRVVAFAADMALLTVLGWGLGALAFDLFASLGGWGRLVGYGIALLYFGILNSSVAGGQTVGKRLAHIRVVNHHDDSVAPVLACIRWLILGLPLLFGPAALPRDGVIAPGGPLLNVLVFGLGGAILYLYLFNGETRQSLHDLVVGTYVVRDTATAELEVGSTPKPHVLVAGAWVGLVFLLSPALPASLTQREQVPELAALEQRLEAMVPIQTARLKRLDTSEAGVWGSEIRADIRVAGPEKHERVAYEAASMIFEQYDAAADLDVVDVQVTYSYDIGIARGSRTSTWRRTAEGWAEAFARPDLR